MGGVTDLLIESGRKAVESGEKRGGKAKWKGGEEAPVKGIEAALKIVEELEKQFQEHFKRLRELLSGISLLKELTPSSLSLISSFGEKLSIALLQGALNSMGVESYLCNSE